MEIAKSNKKVKEFILFLYLWNLHNIDALPKVAKLAFEMELYDSYVMIKSEMEWMKDEISENAKENLGRLIDSFTTLAVPEITALIKVKLVTQGVGQQKTAQLI